MTPKESPNLTACHKFQDDHNASMSWQSHVRNTMDDPAVSSLIDELEKHDQISFWLPMKTSSAGVVLQHCIRVIDDIHTCHGPIIFKVGFTSDPKFRWENRRYGYKWEKSQWTNMVILFLSKEPWSIAMLEASLIDRYYGTLAALGCFLQFKHWLVNCCIEYIIYCLHITLSQGQPGMKNIRRGGDTEVIRFASMKLPRECTWHMLCTEASR